MQTPRTLRLLPHDEPAAICETHWDRRGERVPAVRLGLCHACLHSNKQLYANQNARPLIEAARRLKGGGFRLHTVTTVARAQGWGLSA